LEELRTSSVPATASDERPSRSTVTVLFVVVEDRLKVAVTVVAEETVTEQAPVPEHAPPLHPAKAEPEAATADRLTDVPLFTVSEQSEPQEIPVPVTVPVPVPALDTVRVEVVLPVEPKDIAPVW
jgi:hypothetical protein